MPKSSAAAPPPFDRNLLPLSERTRGNRDDETRPKHHRKASERRTQIPLQERDRRNGTLDLRLPAALRGAVPAAGRRQLFLHLGRRPGRPAGRRRLERNRPRRQPPRQTGRHRQLLARRRLLRRLRGRHSGHAADPRPAHHAHPPAVPAPLGAHHLHLHDSRLVVAGIPVRHALGHFRHRTGRRHGHCGRRMAPRRHRQRRSGPAADRLLGAAGRLPQPQHHQGSEPHGGLRSQGSHRHHRQNAPHAACRSTPRGGRRTVARRPRRSQLLLPA